MKKSEVEKARKIIDRELNKRRYDCVPHISIEESDVDKGWWGVHVRTDGDSYEALYDIYKVTLEGLVGYKKEGPTKWLERILNREMSWKEDEHYFEQQGYGILFIY